MSRCEVDHECFLSIITAIYNRQCCDVPNKKHILYCCSFRVLPSESENSLLDESNFFGSISITEK